MCAERKMHFLGHSAFAVQHMLLHNGMYPQLSSQGSECFMDILNGEIIDDKHWRREPLALKFFFLVALIRLSIKCLSCGKGKNIYVYSRHQDRTSKMSVACVWLCRGGGGVQRCSALGMMFCFLLA